MARDGADVTENSEEMVPPSLVINDPSRRRQDAT